MLIWEDASEFQRIRTNFTDFKSLVELSCRRLDKYLSFAHQEFILFDPASSCDPVINILSIGLICWIWQLLRV
jgi:hypothetical protein